jgi:hypothetical protein
MSTPASAALVTTVATGKAGESPFTLTIVIDTEKGEGEDAAGFQTRQGGSAYGAVASPGSATLVVDGVTQSLFTGSFFAYFRASDDATLGTSGFMAQLFDYDPNDETVADNRYLQLEVTAPSGVFAPSLITPFDVVIDGVDTTAFSIFSLAENLVEGSYQRRADMLFEVDRVFSTVALAPVPAPATMPLFVAGVAVLAAARRRRAAAVKA